MSVYMEHDGEENCGTNSLMGARVLGCAIFFLLRVGTVSLAHRSGFFLQVYTVLHLWAQARRSGMAYSNWLSLPFDSPALYFPGWIGIVLWFPQQPLFWQVFWPDFQITMSSPHEYQGQLGQSQLQGHFYVVALCSHSGNCCTLSWWVGQPERWSF